MIYINSIEIKNKDKNIKIALGNIKVLYGTNLNLKNYIINEIKRSIDKNQSEYSIENNNNVKFDNEIINSNLFEYYTIEENFDIENDLKMGTKSLIYKYLEQNLNKIEYDERFNTIKLLLESLSKDYITDLFKIKLKNSNIEFDINEFNTKQLIKLIMPLILDDEYEKNYLDLDYDELIEYQINIINNISKDNNKSIFVFLNCHINDYIYKLLSNSFKNIYYIIVDNFVVEDYKNILLTNKKAIDLYFIEDNLEYFQENLPFYIDKDKLNNILELYFTKTNCQEIIEFEKII